ncbi:MAG: hypothetical protein IJU95_07655, partial [Treponema sp.]|nr:hypothetical protein [Treponema sp.]
MIILSFLLAVAFTPVPAFSQVVKPGSETNLAVRIPISAGWWAFTDEKWQETVTGIAGVRAGVELYPVREGKSPEDCVFRLYGRAMLCWRAGAGNRSTYKALYNGLGIQPQVLARLNITRQHGIYLGAGMGRFAKQILPLLAVLLSCEVPQDQDWYERPGMGAAYHTHGQRKTDTAVGTMLFEQSTSAEGGTEVLFRTNAPACLAPGGRTEWKVVDTSVSAAASVAVTRRQGSGTAGQGLLFAARSKGGKTYFLAVMVNTRQQYSIAKFLAGEKSVIQDWRSSGLLKGGYGVKNTIGVSASGGDISVYLNGSLETTFRDSSSGGVPALSTGEHGYIV